MKGAPLTGACSCEAGVREAAASVLGPCRSLGRGAPACQRRQSVRSARCWELVHLGALDDGSATHLLRHTGGRASARRAAPTHPTAPIPQDHLRHAFGPARTAGAADLEKGLLSVPRPAPAVCKEWRTLQLFLRVSILPSHGDSKTHFNARNTPQRSPFAAGRRVLVPTGAKVN